MKTEEALEKQANLKAKPYGHRGKKLAVVSKGFYGCGALDRLVRVRMRDARPRNPMTYPHNVNVDCPCGETHREYLMWRALKKGETLDDTEVAL